MGKKFALVYEDEGYLKGSYSGIPNKDDEKIVKRSVLEGSEKVEPQPEPQPTPLADDLSEIDPSYICKLVYLYLGDFEDGDCIYEGDWPNNSLLTFDAIKAYADLAGGVSEKAEVVFRFRAYGNDYICFAVEQTSENSMDVFDIHNLNDLTEEPLSMGIMKYTDAETGDSKILRTEFIRD